MDWTCILVLLGPFLIGIETLNIKYDYTDAELTTFINETVKFSNSKSMQNFIFAALSIYSKGEDFKR